MDETARRGLERLRSPEPVRELAELLVAEALAAPIATVARPRWLATQLAAAMQAATRGDALHQWVSRRISAERERWGAEGRPLRDLVPSEVEGPLRELLTRPYSPDPQLVLRIVDQPAIRALVRVVLTETVSHFRRRMTEWDSGLLGGLGARAAARGRGLLDNVSRNLGGLVDAVRGEVDHVLEGRVNDFVQAATVEAVRTIAEWAADPRHGGQLGEMRIAILDVLLDTPIGQLAAEADKLDPEGAVDVVVAAVRALVARPDFVPLAEARIGALLAEAGDGTLGAWLDEIGLRAVWSASTTDLLAERLEVVVGSPAFAAWWGRLFADPGDGHP